MNASPLPKLSSEGRVAAAGPRASAPKQAEFQDALGRAVREGDPPACGGAPPPDAASAPGPTQPRAAARDALDAAGPPASPATPGTAPAGSSKESSRAPRADRSTEDGGSRSHARGDEVDPAGVAAFAPSAPAPALPPAPRGATLAESAAGTAAGAHHPVSGPSGTSSHAPDVRSGQKVVEGRRVDDSQSARPAASPSPSSGSTPAAEMRPPIDAQTTASSARLAAAAPPSATSVPALPPAPAGVDVAGAVLQGAAHLKIDAGSAGTVDLHLRVRDGTLHLRVDGEAARVLEPRAPELSRALAGEGLKLAPVEFHAPDGGAVAGDATGGSDARRQAWEDAAAGGEPRGTGARAQPRRSSERSSRGSSIDVQA